MLNIKTKNKKPIGLTAFASPLAKPSERKEVLVVGVFFARQNLPCVATKYKCGTSRKLRTCEYAVRIFPSLSQKCGLPISQINLFKRFWSPRSPSVFFADDITRTTSGTGS